MRSLGHRPFYDHAMDENTWWRHRIETSPALLAICTGNSPVAGEFPAQRPVTRSFDVLFDLFLNIRLSKQSVGWRFETSTRPIWRHRNVMGFQGILFRRNDKWMLSRFLLTDKVSNIRIGGRLRIFIHENLALDSHVNHICLYKITMNHNGLWFDYIIPPEMQLTTDFICKLQLRTKWSLSQVESVSLNCRKIRKVVLALFW